MLKILVISLSWIDYSLWLFYKRNGGDIHDKTVSKVSRLAIPLIILTIALFINPSGALHLNLSLVYIFLLVSLVVTIFSILNRLFPKFRWFSYELNDKIEWIRIIIIFTFLIIYFK